jgi:hypothetical protein
MTQTSAVPQVAPDFDTNIQKLIAATGLTHAAGRLYDKVYLVTSAGETDGRYMVERKTGDIFGIKSWNQHNPRRFYGNVSTVDQWDWSVFPAVPKAGTEAETAHQAREATFAQTYKKRGRPVGVKNKPKSLSSATA